MHLHEDSGRAYDEESIREIMDSLARSWNRHDMKAFALAFSEDADFINVGGIKWKGRKEIEEKHAEKHSMQFKDSVLKIDSVDIRFLEPRVAIVHAITRIAGDRDPNGSPRPSPRTTLLMAVAHKNKDAWVLAAAQNTTVVPT